MVHITKKDLDKDNFYKDSEINTTEEIKIICPKLMDIDVEYDALNVSSDEVQDGNWRLLSKRLLGIFQKIE